MMGGRIAFWAIGLWAIVGVAAGAVVGCSDDETTTGGSGGSTTSGTAGDSPGGAGGTGASGGAGGLGGAGGPDTPVPGTAYHVSFSEGDDNNAGTSPEAPWQTLDRVNTQILEPGDGVLFMRGDQWRGELVIPASGTATLPVIYGVYGPGNRPRLLGSLPATDWTEVETNVWRSDVELFDPHDWSTGNVQGSWAAEIWFEETDGSVRWGHPRRAAIQDLQEEYDWTWSEYRIYVFAPSDPGARYASVEVPQHRQVVNLNNQEHVLIDGLGVFYALNALVDQVYRGAYASPAVHALDLHGFVLRRSELAFVGEKDGVGYGTTVMYSDSLFEDNVVHDCGRRGFSLYNYGAADVSNVIVQRNTLYNGSHTTGVDISAGSEFAPTGDVFNVIVRNNLIHDDPQKDTDDPNEFGSELTFVKAVQEYGDIYDLHFQGNVYMYPTGGALHLETISEASIIGNTFYGLNELKSGNMYYAYLDGCQSITLHNNVFYGTTSSNNPGSVLVQLTGGMEFGDVVANHNLYYQQDPAQLLVQRYIPGQYELGVYQFRAEHWSQLQTLAGWETASPSPQPPQLVAPAQGDLHLQSGSPAIGAGAPLGADNDHDDVPYADPRSIGAYEYVE